MIFLKKPCGLLFLCCCFLTIFISCTQHSDEEPLSVKDNLASFQFSTNILQDYTKHELNAIEQKVSGYDGTKKEYSLIWQMKARKIEQLTTTFKEVRDSCVDKNERISTIENCLRNEFELYKTSILQVDPQIAKAMSGLFSRLLIENEFTKVNEIRYLNDLRSLSDYFIAIIENRAISFCNAQMTEAEIN